MNAIEKTVESPDSTVSQKHIRFSTKATKSETDYSFQSKTTQAEKEKSFFYESKGETYYNPNAYPSRLQVVNFHKIAVEEIQKILDRYFKPQKHKFRPTFFNFEVKK